MADATKKIIKLKKKIERYKRFMEWCKNKIDESNSELLVLEVYYGK